MQLTSVPERLVWRGPVYIALFISLPVQVRAVDCVRDLPVTVHGCLVFVCFWTPSDRNQITFFHFRSLNIISDCNLKM